MDPLDLISQGKIRRYFRATRKLDGPNLVSHLTQRAAGREPLFIEEDDYRLMIGLFKQIGEKHFLQFYAFCLMPNHVHILLSPEERNLSDAMRDLFSQYALIFNRKYERKGHLFGGPYRQAVCLDDSYLMAASLYIHLNPVKATLAERADGYRWSSHRLYTENAASQSFVKPDFVLRLLSEDLSEAKGRYRELITAGEALHLRPILEQEDAIERFRRKMSALFPSLFKHIDGRSRVIDQAEMNLLSLKAVEKQLRLFQERKYSLQPEDRKAKKFLIDQLVARGYKMKEIAERLGVSRKTVYNILRTEG